MTLDRVTRGNQWYLWTVWTQLSSVSFLDLLINEETVSIICEGIKPYKLSTQIPCIYPSFTQGLWHKISSNCFPIFWMKIRMMFDSNTESRQQEFPHAILFRLEYLIKWYSLRLRNSFSKQTMPFNDQINSFSVYQKNATESHSNSLPHKIGEYVRAGVCNWPWIRLCNYFYLASDPNIPVIWHLYLETFIASF